MGGYYMSKEFKVGDVIIYKGLSHLRETGLKQLIYEIVDDNFHTKFIEIGKYNMMGEKNIFDIDSIYYTECELVSEDSKYENGVPLIWEDVI